MVDDILGDVRSHVRDQENLTHLTASIGAADTSFTVSSTAGLSRGRVQIGDEILWVDSADSQGTTATVSPFGRGMDGTTAASHSSGDMVTISPLFPRHVVKAQINRAIRTVGTQLYGVATTTLTPSATAYIYELPAAVRDVLSVRVSTTLDGGASVFLRAWSLDKNAPTTVSSTGKALAILDGVFASPTQIDVVYSTDPLTLSADGDDFTDSLLPASAEDVVTLLVESRMLATVEASAIAPRSVESGALASKYPPGPGLNQSKYLYQLHVARLAEEGRRLLNASSRRMSYQR